MTEQEKRELVVRTGRELLQEGLLVRTWGNISCRLDEGYMLITPSGRDYMSMHPEDLPVVDLAEGEWEGRFKPSGEKKVHIAAYETFPEDNFVIHTHQICASAISVYGIVELDISPEEHKMLGGLAQAEYGLPGTKKLTNAVEAAMKTGAHTVLMQNHGAVISAESYEQAMERARLLEEICKRSLRGVDAEGAEDLFNEERRRRVEAYLEKRLPFVKCVSSDALLMQAFEEEPIPAQLDDMAQMIGEKVPVAHNIDQVMKMLRKYHAVLIPGVGAAVAGQDEDDTDALEALLEKAAVTIRHTKACEEDVQLSAFDINLMHLVYTMKYAKQKKES